MQLLSPSFLLVAARQPGKVLGRALLRACGWLSLLGVTRKGHHGLTAQSHRCLLPCPLVGQSWFVFCAFRRCQGREGLGCWELYLQSQPEATVTQTGSPETGAYSPRNQKLLSPLVLGQMLSVLCKELAVS